MIKHIIALLLLTSCVSAYELTGDNLIEPRYYDGNLLIFNDGGVSYSIFSDGTYLGTIEINQGMYVNESCDYKIYASYSDISGLTTEKVEKKINQYWYIFIVGVILLLFAIKIYKVIK